MTQAKTELVNLVTQMAHLMEANKSLDPQMYSLLFDHPEFAFEIIALLDGMNEESTQEDPPLYSACIFALDICIAQLQAAMEINSKVTSKMLNQLMDYLAETISTHKHSLSYWLPILNAFYEVHVELSEPLRNAYFELATLDDTVPEASESSYLDSIRDLIHDLSDLSVFDIAENFFAQSYAMPPDFFADLVVDLYNINVGQDIALLTLLHPTAEVRGIVVSILDQVLDHVTLSSISLSRLEVIKHWYPKNIQPIFDKWIKTQRKKGVIFEIETKPPTVFIKATEVDGSGSQGLFIHIRNKRKNRLCGLLLKDKLGIKDAWTTPAISSAEVKEYYHQAFEESVTIRSVDMPYFKLMVEHFLAVTCEQGQVPNLHFLEIQELLGLRLRPNKLDVENTVEQLSILIDPFTQEIIAQSLSRSKSWLKTKKFTESWYLESPIIDKIVNHNSSFVDGVKVCRLNQAMDAVFLEEMEQHRDKWLFHFLWIALWIKANEKKNEKIWQDSFLIAYLIHENKSLKEIPVMQEICRQTVINSIETMQERRTHLNQE